MVKSNTTGDLLRIRLFFGLRIKKSRVENKAEICIQLMESEFFKFPCDLCEHNWIFNRFSAQFIQHVPANAQGIPVLGWPAINKNCELSVTEKNRIRIDAILKWRNRMRKFHFP